MKEIVQETRFKECELDLLISGLSPHLRGSCDLLQYRFVQKRRFPSSQPVCHIYVS
jgi:hypothetical protein